MNNEAEEKKWIGKLYYSIGEVAEFFDMNTSKLRFWEKEFAEIKPQKNANGERRYTQEDIEKIKMIYHLVEEKGFTLEGARQKLRHNPQGVKGQQEVVEKLKKIRNYLLELKKELN